jgi:hypothetical protein
MLATQPASLWEAGRGLHGSNTVTLLVYAAAHWDNTPAGPAYRHLMHAALATSTIATTFDALLTAGELVDEASFCARSRLTPAQLAAAVAEGRVFRLKAGEARGYPAFFLDPNLDLEQVEAARPVRIQQAPSLLSAATALSFCGLIAQHPPLGLLKVAFQTATLGTGLRTPRAAQSLWGMRLDASRQERRRSAAIACP